MVCRADLWDVERHVSAGTVQLCAGCVDAVKHVRVARGLTGDA